MKDYSYLLPKHASKAAEVATEDSVYSALKQCAADTFTLFALAKSAHWSIESSTFFELHKAFDDLHEMAEEGTDTLVERARQLQTFITVDLAAFQSLAGFPIPSSPQPANTWVKAVLAGLDKTIDDLTAMKRVAGTAGDLDSQDIGISISREFSKIRWMFRSTQG